MALRIVLWKSLMSVLVFVFWMGVGTAMDWKMDQWRYELKYSHLVFDGTVVGVSDTFVPLADLATDLDKVGGVAKTKRVFQVVTFEVNRVLRGGLSGKTIVTVAVSASFAGFDLNYEVGERMIMSVWKKPGFADDIFLLTTEAGRLRFDNGGSLYGQFEGKRSVGEIDEIVASASIDSVAKRADTVVVGEVVAAGPVGEPGTKSAGERDVTFKILAVMKGQVQGERLKLRIDTWGKAVNGVLHAAVPDVQIGETWYVFLRSVNENFEVLDGANGFIKLQNDRLIYDNVEVLPITKEELDSTLGEVSR